MKCEVDKYIALLAVWIPTGFCLTLATPPYSNLEIGIVTGALFWGLVATILITRYFK